MTSIQPVGEFAALGGIFASPYVGNQVNARVDVQLSTSHNFFTRYTHDRNSAFALLGPVSLPSGWSRRVNRADQAVAGLTSVLSPRIVNDLRFAYFSTPVDVTPATADDCNNCFGLGATRTTVQNAGMAFGTAGGFTSTGRRLQLTENLVWQKGNHSLRAGFDWEHNESRGVTVAPPSGEITVFPPSVVRQEAPQIPLPASFTTVEDILQLPLRSFSITVGSGTILWPGLPRRASDRSLSAVFRRHVARRPPSHRELRARIFIRAECIQPRLGEAGTAGANSRDSRFESSPGRDAQLFSNRGLLVDGHSRQQDCRPWWGRALLRPGGQHECIQSDHTSDTCFRRWVRAA